jgi:hypothetical protein
MTEIDWLGGRGYNMLGMKIPVTFHGERTLSASFLTVLWESLADPIISGRDELGFAKIYAEIGPPRIFQGNQHHSASWLGFKFFELELSNLRDVPLDIKTTPDPSNQGTLHWKYVPKTGEPGKADVSYLTLTPTANPHLVVEKRSSANGSFRFREARWEDLPTMFQIVNAFARLDLLELRSATVTESRGNKDLGDQQIVR